MISFRWWFRVIGILIIGIALGIHLWVPSAPQHNGWLSRVNALWYDLRFQMLPPKRQPIMPIVIVDIDEYTQSREGRWPWDRSKISDLIAQLRHYGSALIGFDVVFSEPSDNAAQSVLDHIQQQGTHTVRERSHQKLLQKQLEELTPQLDGDTQLAQQLDIDTVLGFFFHNDGFNAGTLPPAPIILPSEEGAATIIEMNNYTANLETLNLMFPPSGFVVTVPDGDGIVRRLALIMRYGEGIFTSLSVELARLALGAPWIRLEMEEEGDRQLLTNIQLGNALRIPIDLRGQMLVPYRGAAGSFPTISATHVLQGDADANGLEKLDGAIVLIGTSALGLADLRNIPLQTNFPGVEIHANVLDTILNAYWQKNNAESTKTNPFYLSPDWADGAITAQILFFGLLLALGLPGRQLWQMLVGTLI